ncbi:hypothetical protein EES44_07875 [Streptomyces sp. ADI96-15]|uniref:hypothetical protein n=1 Tax=Streptomyces sp. ADI96-15 TaxID=1522761 RepID=UPI000F5504BA|nr:hypothetical protein [Streptomyces sp. ADI96-15]RPK69039.1 hypothetical protein EES44_07875 [Streptomyces sp. ADI96-15]
MTEPTAYTPLFRPESWPPTSAPTVNRALDVAREALANSGKKNIHVRSDMIAAATDLYVTLHQLVIALDAERGEGR